MCLYLSYIVGGSVCVGKICTHRTFRFPLTKCLVIKPASGQLLHLEPLDLKRLQAKSLNDYVADIATAERVTCSHVFLKYIK